MFIFRRCCRKKENTVNYNLEILKYIQNKDFNSMKIFYEQAEKNKCQLETNLFLERACKNNLHSMVEYFVQKGANVNVGIKATNSPNILKILLEKKN